MANSMTRMSTVFAALLMALITHNACLVASEAAATASTTDTAPTQEQDASDNPVNSATVQGLDGTKINLLVNSDGQAVTVATQNPNQLKSKRKKHTVIGNPVDEPLSTGLVNISSLSLVEDAQPELSNPLP